MTDIRIIQTIASTRVDHGGTSRSVPALCDALSHTHDDVHLLVGVPESPAIGSIFPNPKTQTHRVTEPTSGRWQLGRVFAQKLAELVQPYSVVHDHGVWLGSNHAVASVCRRRRVVRIVSPRGMVGQWAMRHGQWKKRIAWWAYQRRDLLTATAFHATSDQEAEEIRALGCTQPIAVIPNGLTKPDRLPSRQRGVGTRVLFMSRIHPKKGLLKLVEAWHQAKLPMDWELILAGPDENSHRHEVAQAIDRLGLAQVIRFVGPIADEDKWQAYVDADLFILPSFNENFGIVIAEAMSVGLPIITTTGTPWSVLHQRQAGWWVAPTVDALRDALKAAATTPIEELKAMGHRGADYVTATYSWSEVGIRMLDFYEQTLANLNR